MAPPVVFPLVNAVHPMPLSIVLVPLSKINAVSTIFVVVPHVIVTMVPIVIPLFAMRAPLA